MLSDMNVYDFDDTIYRGDSSRDFIFYMYRKHPVKMLAAAPRQFAAAVGYMTGRKSKKEMKETFFSFLKKTTDVEQDVKHFWDAHQKNMKPWYLRQKREEDVVISASPDFLLEEICRREGIRHLIATRMDRRSGAILGENCKGEEKVKRFREIFPQEVAEAFYSDHPSDRYMAGIAKEAFLVRGDQISEWEIRD